MKIKKASQWFSLLLLTIIVVSCAQSNDSIATSSLAAPSSVSPTTILSTITSTATGTLTPAPALTTVPTLSVEDARKRLLDLLANNGGCYLPCLWGIMPGKNTYQEAQSILSPLSSISVLTGFRSGLGSVSPVYIDNDNLRLTVDAGFLSNSDQIVSHLNFQALEEKVITDSSGNWISRQPIYGLPTFIQRVEYYSLSHLLSEQGIPTSVMIASSGPSTKRSGSITFYLVVLYPSQGIWAQYTTSINEDRVGSVIRSCPVNAHIEMELYPPGNPDSFYALLDKTDWGITKDSYELLEEATSMSVEEFYQIFRNPTDKCIETPTNLWPTPER